MEMTLEMKNAVNRRRAMLERGVITKEEYDKFVDTLTTAESDKTDQADMTNQLLKGVRDGIQDLRTLSILRFATSFLK